MGTRSHLAIFDLLRAGKTLTEKEVTDVRDVATKVLKNLKEEKLRIGRWPESRQITAQVKTIIYDTLQWLPQETYTDPEMHEKSISVYQNIYANYPGGVYGRV